jgi:hypothetical protein
VLRYAGFMGHQYISIHTLGGGERQLRSECNTLADALRLFNPNDQERTVYRRTAKSWRVATGEPR